MNQPDRTVSEEALNREWEEIRAAQRNPALFRPLYDRYYPPVFRLIHRRTADADLTADLCSQVFLKALQKLPDYSYKGVPFSAWLYRIALNEVGQHFRQNRQGRVVSLEQMQLGNMLADMDAEDREHLYEQMTRALDDLPETDMQLIELRFFEQRSYQEIADILDLTLSNAKVKVHRILERLKRKLMAGGTGN